jgi:hypothetical protein
LKLDGLGKSLRSLIIVIPAEAGIQLFRLFWTPAFAGMT